MKTIKNQVQLVGRLGANPEMKMFENGSKLARFSVAVTNTRINKKGEKTKKVQWYTITAWGALALIAEKILHKGTQVTVDGKLNIRSFLNNEGLRRSKTEVTANQLFVAQAQLALTA